MSRTSKTQPAPPAKPSGQLSWKDRLNPQDYEELKSTFEIFDEDGSGTIDPAEINKVLEELGLDKRNPFILTLIHGLRDQNRPINFEEFLSIIGSKVGETKTKDGLRRVFSLFDKDENGSVDFEELKTISRQLHENLNDDDLLELLHSTHINQKTATNEGIDFEEFYRIVSRWANK
jgi:Ca2+-binding EF-hand superfamily protein